jgi:hypothetical protein
MNYGPIPFATYMQTFNSVESYDTRVFRNPSASELRFNNFAALAFNAKMLIGFEYNAGAASLFNIVEPGGYSGDTFTNALYGEQADVNHRAIILGRSLACMQPVYDLHNASDSNPPPGPASAYSTFPADGAITTSILILKGSPGTTNSTPEPSGFAESPSSTNYSWWEFKKNDPYFNGWTVSNMGTNNGGLAGQVIISWFTPLETSLEGANYTNEIYMMVVNALTANSGSETDCLQQIKLNFETGTNITAVNMLDLEAGVVTTNTMPVIGGSGNTTKRQLVLNLNGGDAAFFKFADGAPFVGHVPPAVPKLSAGMQGGFPAITVQGTPLARYQLQSAPALTGANWSVVSNCLFTNAAVVFVDTTASGSNSIYYRAVGIP